MTMTIRPSVAVAPASPSSSPSSSSRVHLRDRETGRVCVFTPPPTDIGGFVGFSLKRCVFSLVGLGLVLTDIPRTGFAVRLKDFYPQVGVDQVMYWGPYIYPAYHLNITDDDHKYAAWSGDAPVAGVDVWMYKFDTLSAPTRAATQLLGLPSTPRCVLYHGPCPTSTLSPGTVFGMLDELTTTLRTRYFVRPQEDPRPVTLLARTNWRDRLHHVMVQAVWAHREHRWITIHHRRFARGVPFVLCRAAQGTAPLFCALEVPWPCDHPIEGPTTPISIERHIAVRLELLQLQYPELELDVTIFTTRLHLRPLWLKKLPRISMVTDNVEIVTLIRGRRCVDGPQAATGRLCETRFIDDYRYERAHAESDEEAWQPTTKWLRAIAQGYVWLRVAFLWGGCYAVQRRDLTVIRRIIDAWAIFFKIPGYTVVYGSWVPIVLYSMAHYIDGVVIHLLGDYVSATLNGEFDFEFYKFFLVASVQMRNIWLIALWWRLLILGCERFCAALCVPWGPVSGVLGVRGLLIGLTSWLTIFSYLRALRFRDTNVVEVTELPRDADYRGFVNTANSMESGFTLDAKAMAISSTVVGLLLLLVQSLLRWGFRTRVNVFVARSYYVPLGADILWPRSMLGLFWKVTWTRRHNVAVEPIVGKIDLQSKSLQNVPASAATEQRNPQRDRCPHCRPQPWFLDWQGEQGCALHVGLLRLDRRTADVWSLHRLMNLTFMSDPLVLFELYVLGRSLYLYTDSTKMDPDRGSLLLPRRLNDEIDTNCSKLRLVAVVDSSTVPWHALVDVA